MAPSSLGSAIVLTERPEPRRPWSTPDAEESASEASFCAGDASNHEAEMHRCVLEPLSAGRALVDVTAHALHGRVIYFLPGAAGFRPPLRHRLEAIKMVLPSSPVADQQRRAGLEHQEGIIAEFRITEGGLISRQLSAILLPGRAPLCHAVHADSKACRRGLGLEVARMMVPEGRWPIRRW